MAIYKAFVKEKQSKEYLFVESDYKTKKDFIQDLKSNGYAVNPKKVMLKEKYDYLLYGIKKG